jgi:hypothetical protein
MCRLAEKIALQLYIFLLAPWGENEPLFDPEKTLLIANKTPA